jgi:hypothetical protein
VGRWGLDCQIHDSDKTLHESNLQHKDSMRLAMAGKLPQTEGCGSGEFPKVEMVSFGTTMHGVGEGLSTLREGLNTAEFFERRRP